MYLNVSTVKEAVFSPFHVVSLHEWPGVLPGMFWRVQLFATQTLQVRQGTIKSKIFFWSAAWRREFEAVRGQKCIQNSPESKSEWNIVSPLLPVVEVSWDLHESLAPFLTSFYDFLYFPSQVLYRCHFCLLSALPVNNVVCESKLTKKRILTYKIFREFWFERKWSVPDKVKKQGLLYSL